ncbi:MAG: RNA 2'-phosphotransferase [Proteobacteria bacterium]|nr:RNA 2'-phosphotransferase [Pseudomonadota bacterium]
MDELKSLKQILKLISYILERKPDEFGLVPDENGYIKIKSLLFAINEDEGFKFVRRHHIHDVLSFLPESQLEINDDKIRSKYRDNLPIQSISDTPPKLLYTCVRKKAHSFTLEKGIFPVGNNKVVLSPVKEMALRIGKRFNQSPVVLTVNTQKALETGIIFYNSGDLYFAETIPPDCFTAPLLPKQKEEPAHAEKQKEITPKHMPGSYILNLEIAEEEKKRTKLQRKKKEISWKKERKRMSRVKI